MGKSYRLYWSSLELYEQCPQKFLWYRGWGTLDVGGGQGKRKPLRDFSRKSEHHALMGIVIAEAVEKIYNDEWWRQPKELRDRLNKFIEREFSYQIQKSYIKWTESPPESDLLDTCKKGVLGYLKIMKHNRLLGDLYARSEVTLKAELDGIRMGGRPDVIINRSDTGLLIIDGKNSKSPGRYTNKDQLRWYALLYYLTHQKMASLAFAYFRYPPDNPPESHLKKKNPAEWTGLIPVSVTESDVLGLMERARQVYKSLLAEEFKATPSSNACRFCEYQNDCVPFQEKQLEKTDQSCSGKGFIDFSFD